MSTIILSEKEKGLLFWASFLGLLAAATGFVFRTMIPTMWEDTFQLTASDVGSLTGAALWPIAVTMILFSLLLDKIGYKVSMFCAFLLQSISVVLTISAKDYDAMWWACICAGLGHGIVEAVINPLCASIYREEKSKWLNILHASWPAGIVFGGTAYILLVGTDSGLKWEDSKWIFWFMLAPVFAYGVLFFMCKRFPVDERVEAGVGYRDMLKEFGGLGVALASTFIIYELSTQLGIAMGAYKLQICMGIGALLGLIAGLLLKSWGKILFFVLCLIMIPLAAAEIATDGWIRSLMEPIMGSKLAAWAVVFSAAIMMGLRFFAGIPLRWLNPPQLLLVSSVFSIIGLFALSVTSGWAIFGAFTLYAVGQTFYWPTVLGFVSEQFPRGGAVTLNTVSAMGLLTVGIFGFPFLGAVKDNYSTKSIVENEPGLVELVKSQNRTFTDASNPEEPKEIAIFEKKTFFGYGYDSINAAEFKKLPEIDDTRVAVLDGTLAKTSQSSLRVAAVLPLIMAGAFLLIIIYYKLKGGYRVVGLDEES